MSMKAYQKTRELVSVRIVRPVNFRGRHCEPGEVLELITFDEYLALANKCEAFTPEPKPTPAAEAEPKKRARRRSKIDPPHPPPITPETEPAYPGDTYTYATRPR